jgi:hypothetical protein
MSKTINIILLVSIYFLISCSEMTTLYKKKSRGKIETINTYSTMYATRFLLYIGPLKMELVAISMKKP